MSSKDAIKIVYPEIVKTYSPELTRLIEEARDHIEHNGIESTCGDALLYADTMDQHDVRCLLAVAIVRLAIQD